ncbi:tetraacyldisaccharide 4'-kinase [Flavobacterium restrictum]|uniref:Tetraacyldisaccharide 4'-kinase n=1 Tax=Flavobacterium restrictum TaxID=2594428 RepID=A0A553E2D4_9FLAO|nr:tetraacyldisaccharide 4'-kinase [Flavobacterium restrictum]TRX39201.1 tetraacyldisaccharide 4'-kinase [Flavobacterium restrictum]
MMLLRKILFPFSILYGLITSIRNFLFDRGVLNSYSFEIPIIAVGNLSVGGTGKTPQIEYLIRLLSPTYQVATLSRGYKRQSKGFILANATSNAAILGDEPFQFYKKFPSIQVAVDANRKNGIEQLLLQTTKPKIILLDDAFQHRKVKAGLYILLTTYGDLYCDDWMLPTGNLRESSSGAQRANVVIVTKCNPNLSVMEQNEIRAKLKLASHQDLYFTSIGYDACIFDEDKTMKVSQIKPISKVLLAGIAKPTPFFDYLKNETDVCLTFPDHHHFSESDIQSIQQQALEKIIVTTEKDYVRLKDSALVKQLFYLPIQSQFLSESEQFNATILDYAVKKMANK